MAQSGVGRIKLFDDFVGPEKPIADTDVGPINFSPFIITGDGMDETDAGVIQQATLSGVVRLTTTDQDNHNCAVGTDVMFDVALMSPLILEARVQMSALTDRRCYVGFSNENDGTEVQWCEANTGTITLTKSDLCGFLFDSGATSDNWLIIFNGGTTTGKTAESDVDTGIAPVDGEWDILRVEIYVDGRARFYINGVMVSSTVAGVTGEDVEGAVLTTIDLAGLVSAGGTTTTIATVDLDYLLIKASRDWTR